MEPIDLKTLLLLEAIDKEGDQSQRELSRKLNMSLGLVNTFIKKMKNRGVFKTSSLPGNKVKYILTSEGLAEKTDLTINYISYSIQHYKEIKQRVSKVLTAPKLSGKRKIVFYGAGELCEIACVILSEKKLYEYDIIDDAKAGEKICGITIHKEAEIVNLDYDAIFIMQLRDFNSTRRRLKVRGVPSDKIFSIFPKDTNE